MTLIYKPGLKIVIMVYAKEEVGLGHWYRSVALADEAERLGHMAWIVGNRMLKGRNYFQVREGQPDDLYHVLDQIRPDFLVLDLQDRVPDYIYDLTNGLIKTVVLNGVGREEEDKADITIVQGFSGKSSGNVFTGPEYVILRPSLLKNGKAEKSDAFFVWGGAKDKMGLIPMFQRVMPDRNSHILVSEFFNINTLVQNPNHKLYQNVGNNIGMILEVCRKACISMGMAGWEMCAVGIPSYVFSWSDGHLKFAKEMEGHGLLRAWDRIGLPSDSEIREFLETPFEITGDRPDGKGAERIVRIMESYK